MMASLAPVDAGLAHRLTAQGAHIRAEVVEQGDACGQRPSILMVGGMALIGAGIAVLAFTHAGQRLWLAEASLLLTGVGVLGSVFAAGGSVVAGFATAMALGAAVVFAGALLVRCTGD
jgi:hypothetical protein